MDARAACPETAAVDKSQPVEVVIVSAGERRTRIGCQTPQTCDVSKACGQLSGKARQRVQVDRRRGGSWPWQI